VKLSFETIELVPRYVFRTARTTSASSESVIVRLEGSELVGIGEAAPSRFYGETAETVTSFLEQIRPRIEHCAHEAEVMAELTSRGGTSNPAARAALEIAAHDIIGQRFERPVHRLFGLDPEDAPDTVMSIGLDTPDVMLRKAREASGFATLKIKLDRETDPEIVRDIKEATGAAITVDANCAWTPIEAIERIKVLADIGVEFVEQPVGAKDIDGLRLVHRHAGVPVFADESCPTSAQIPLVEGAVDGIVIKLMKCGGLVEAVRMARMARDRGLSTMIGCMLESSLAITAAAHISPLMDWADLDSGLLLADDPFVGVRIDGGRMTLPEEPGLGVRAA
jgi:L-alanine-DL-glutamate epimerase-like enolase superfamily enzyme